MELCHIKPASNLLIQLLYCKLPKVFDAFFFLKQFKELHFSNFLLLCKRSVKLGIPVGQKDRLPYTANGANGAESQF